MAPTRRRAVTVATIAVLAALVLAACEPAPAPGTSDSPSGHVDSVTIVDGGIRIVGWASDWNTTRPIKVTVSTGRRTVAVVTADVARPDVARAFGRGANYGFDTTIDVRAVPGQQVCVSAVNVGPGDHTLLGCTSARVHPITTTTTTAPDRCAADPVPDVDLSGCDLSGIDFGDADLAGANLYGTGLTGADLSGADLTGANLGGANLTETDLSSADLTGADLSRSSLTNASAIAADLTEADMSHAYVQETDFVDALLVRADLTSSDFYGGDFTNADFTDAIVVDAGFNDVHFSNTTCPAGFKANSARRCSLYPIER